MSSTDAPSRHGRNVARSAEPPAKPAAATNGNRGKQQLEAPKALAMAPTLAKFVRRFVLTPESDTADLPSCFPYCGPYPLDRRHARSIAAIHVGATRQPKRFSRPGRWLYIQPVDPN